MRERHALGLPAMTDAELRARAATIWSIVHLQSMAAGDKVALMIQNDPMLKRALQDMFIQGYVTGVHEHGAKKEAA